ncbi:Mu-like prophage FluMu protein gp41 [Leminorella richardii]|uniref:Mu-like prophage FluMu protein gp41 n=1 Tax=Leminorella richardii TaxID=158841 RepID=A0A2X4U580_9GAMM|nr:phage tail assembly protein [Leminorella richardii]SQI34936.1 Mu-like prophage FluMu protein gp41 [Leminorella richardii]
MSTTLTLTTGLKVGEEYHREVDIQELTAQHMIDADAASERVVESRNGPVLVKSPSRMTYELMRRAVKRIGPINGPISITELGKLTVEDLSALESAIFNHQEQSLSSAVEREGR